MNTLLVPGLWLDASSWDDVVPPLQAAGLSPRPLTMPGVGASAADSSEIGIAEWVHAVVAEIDALDGPVALVGHSGGGNVVWGAAEARADRIARVVFVDTVPPHDGGEISDFDIVDGVIPFPGWDFFDEEEIADIDGPTRARWAARAKSVPANVPTDPIPLAGARRYSVPVTILSGGMDEESFRASIRSWGPYAEEFAAIADAEIIRLGTGHWPQFSDPEGLSRALVAALR